jgi:hypothetical protein
MESIFLVRYPPSPVPCFSRAHYTPHKGTFTRLTHLQIDQILPRDVLSQLKRLEYLECALPLDVLNEGEAQILPPNLQILILRNGGMAPVLRTLCHLKALHLFNDGDETPVRPCSTCGTGKKLTRTKQVLGKFR